MIARSKVETPPAAIKGSRLACTKQEAKSLEKAENSARLQATWP